MSDEGETPDPFIGLVGLVDLGRSYASAPIVEATIDLRVSLPESVGLDELSGLYADLDAPSPFFEFIPRVEDDRLVASNDQKGFRYSSKNEFVVNAGLDRFSFSQVSRYQDWTYFIGQVEPRWQRFREVTTPQRITNVGVRYVNRIVIPKIQIEINDYLRTTVDISPYLPQAISRYFAQISFAVNAFGVQATVTTTMVEPPVPESTALVLDIDVSNQGELDPGSGSFDQDLTAVLERLRSAKNYVFEACITDATRGVIDSGVHKA